MGRNQVHSAQRQVAHQQVHNSKAAAQSKQPLMQPTSNTARPQSPQQQHSHQRHQDLPSKNAQVYRPTPVKEHPDDAFLTGAWMFDSSRVPQWMLSQHGPQQQASRQMPTANLPQSRQRNSSTPNPKPPSRQNINAQVYRPTAIKSAHPDDTFFSGAWLFDQSSVPQWLASQLPAPSSKSRAQLTGTVSQQDPQLALLDGWAIDSLKPLPNAVEVLEAKEEQRLAMEIERRQHERTQTQSSVRQRRAAEMSGKRQLRPVQGI